MTGAEWGMLFPLILALIGALTAYLKAHTATKTANAAKASIVTHAASPNGHDTTEYKATD